MFPLTIILLILWGITFYFWGLKFFKKVLAGVWILYSFLSVLGCILEPYSIPMKLKKKHIYGKYVVDRTKFPGKQADWQYQNFRFEITKSNEMNFEYRINNSNWQQEKVKIRFGPGMYDNSCILNADRISDFKLAEVCA